MLHFTVTDAGGTSLGTATVGTNPLIITAIALYSGVDGSTLIHNITDFSGSVYNDESGIGPYAKIVFEDTGSDAYTCTKIALKAGETIIANSNLISFTKAASKGLKLELSCQFDNADKCGFNTYTASLPTATKFREGVVRLAGIQTTEEQKNFTVYNAADVDTMIGAISTDLSGNYVPWDKSGTTATPGNATVHQLKVVDNYNSATQTTTITTTSGGQLSIDKTLTGNVVASSATLDTTNHAISGASSSDKVVNEKYIDSLYSNAVIVSSSPTDKLVSGYAVNELVNGSSNDFVHKAGAETITGVKTFSNANIVTSGTTLITGSAVQSEYSTTSGSEETITWNSSANESKLPTVDVVNKAITKVVNDYAAADTNLQSQIDGINAGQNLADMVATKAALDALSITNLQVGDKVEVLADETHDGASTVYNLSSTNPKTWTYIGKYGQDSYTKAEADLRYAQLAANNTFTGNNTFNGDITVGTGKSISTPTISSASYTGDGVYNTYASNTWDTTGTGGTENKIPTVDAVNDYVTAQISTAGGNYVKLESATTQTIASPLVFKASSAATATLSIPDGQSITANNTLTVKADNTTTSVSSIYDLTNTAYTVKLGSDTALDLRKTGSTPVADASGDLVASYRSYTGGTLSDGRLVTVDYLTHFTGDMSAYAKLASSNTFTGDTNTFKAISATTVTTSTSVSSPSYTGTGVYSTYNSTSWADSSNASKIPTQGTVKSAIDAATESTLNTLSTTNAVGSIGLFIYSESGSEKPYGTIINGQYLKPVAMSLSMSGQISYKSVASSPAMSGSWKLLSAAMKVSATEPCLVMAQKVNATYPSA